MVYADLRAGRPVIYAGEGWGTHCFVCDGYRAEDNAFHFNWGWGAEGNYYQISGTDIDFLYPNKQQALFGVMPDRGGDYVPLFYGGSMFDPDVNKSFAMQLTYGSEKIMSYDYDYSTGSQQMYFSCSGFVGALTSQKIELAVQATERTTGYTVYLRNEKRPSTVSDTKSFGYHGG